MPHQSHRSLTIQVDGAGVGAGAVVLAIDEHGARLRLPGSDEEQERERDVDLRFAIPSLGLALEVRARIGSVSQDEHQSATIVSVEFGALDDGQKPFIDACRELRQAALREAEGLTMGLFDPAVMQTLDGRPLHFNMPYIRLSGVRPRALQNKLDTGTPPFDVLTDDPMYCVEVAQEAVRSARAVHLAQTRVANLAGDTYLGTLSFIPVLGPFGQVVAYIQTFRDESAENRMQEHYKQLLTYERRRTERLTKLVTGLAHQINTPLGIINTAGSLIDNSLDSPVAYISDFEPPDREGLDELFSELRESAMLLEKNVARVNSLVNKVKDLSSAQLIATRENADLGVLLEEALITVSQEMRRKGVSAKLHRDTDQDYPWDGYPDHLTRVLRELVFNTILHAYSDSQGGIIDIKLVSLDTQERYEVEVTDYGSGIRKDLLSQIFEPFVTSKPAKATGLGLAIVENIVTNLLGGTILCTSEDGRSTFTIILPKKAPHPAL